MKSDHAYVIFAYLLELSETLTILSYIYSIVLDSNSLRHMTILHTSQKNVSKSSDTLRNAKVKTFLDAFDDLQVSKLLLEEVGDVVHGLGCV